MSQSKGVKHNIGVQMNQHSNLLLYLVPWISDSATNQDINQKKTKPKNPHIQTHTRKSTLGNLQYMQYIVPISRFIPSLTFIFSNNFILVRVMVDPEPFPRTQGAKQGIHAGWDIIPSQCKCDTLVKQNIIMISSGRFSSKHLALSNSTYLNTFLVLDQFDS